MSNALPIENLSNTYLEHSMVINNFVIKIGSQIKDSLCRVFGNGVQYEWRENDDKVIIPDVSIICNLRDRKNISFTGIPRFVMEVLSNATEKYDRHEKMDIYCKVGVSEYWIVDWRKKSVEIYLFDFKEDGTGYPYLYKTVTAQNKEDLHLVMFPNLKITFDELSTLNQPSASLRTALDKISAALGSVGDAGQQARSVVDELRVSLRAAAAQSVKSARSLAKFDEINRLSAPAEDKTAAPEKQKKAAEAAAKAEEAARSTTGTAARRSGTAGSDLSGLTAVWQSVLESLRGAWADFWAYLQEFFAPFAAAWQTVWQGLSAAAAGVWEQLCAALSTVVQPALALLDTVWQGLWAGMEQAWAAYGQPILDGLAQGWQNVVGIVSALWSEVLQPVLVQLFDLLGALWTAHLQPLWNELTACLGAVTTLLLTLWNTVLAPFVQWLITALAPVAVQVFAALGTAVTGAAGIIADGITIALAVLRGMADFLTAVLRGEWDAAWAAMAGTVSTVWGRIVSIVQTAVSTVLGVVRSMVAAIAAAINGLLSAIGHAKSMAGSVLGGAGKLVSSQSALLGLGYAASVPVPALAQGAVIPPNRQFLAMLGDQTTGTNVEAPLATIKQAMAETLAGWQGSADGQPINIYIGEELLDSVIANSQNRRALRSGGR